MKILHMGIGKGLLPNKGVTIPADKAIRGNGKSSIKTNPARKNCIAWTDKKTGLLVFREDYEKQRYDKYCNEIADSQGDSVTALSQSEYVKEILWS